MIEDSEQESLQHSFKSGARQVGEVTALSSDGRGIVKSRGQVFFAERVVTGDRVAFTPDTESNPMVAVNPKVLKLSAFHCEHPCRHAKECPASEWGIVTYDCQLTEKTELVRRVLRGAVDGELVADIWPSPQQWGYRNRLTLQVRMREHGGAELGYATGARGAGFSPIKKCLLAIEPVASAVGHAGWILRDLRELTVEILPDRMMFFDTSEGPGAMAIFKGRPVETDVQHFLELAKKIELPGGIWGASSNQVGIVGERGTFWREEECRAMQVDWLGHKLEAHPAGFAQVNEEAFAEVLSYLKSLRDDFAARTVWDLYGGYGALGFAAARDGSRVHVVEQSGLVESTFAQLAKLRPNVEAELQQGEAARVVPKLARKISEDDLVILDPPKSGCHPEVLAALMESKLHRIAYLSCNPARLSRDLKILAEQGFQAKMVQPMDFFPQTPEIEVLAIAER
ncbi:MAG: class I SAM-dependent RNA methyltransferase [bacterium]|nr:class I SAM-dependent RNA methyltransferase [bacterium]